MAQVIATIKQAHHARKFLTIGVKIQTSRAMAREKSLIFFQIWATILDLKLG